MDRLVRTARRVRRAAPRLLVACATIVLCGWGQPGGPTEQGPICRVSSVVDVMARQLRQRDHYARIERRLIAEYPAGTPNVVLCGVWAVTLRYDARHYGDLPLMYTVIYEFRVRALLGGYVVKLLH